jgi:hypothetical protein
LGFSVANEVDPDRLEGQKAHTNCQGRILLLSNNTQFNNSENKILNDNTKQLGPTLQARKKVHQLFQF